MLPGQVLAVILVATFHLVVTKDTDLKGPPYVSNERNEQHRSVNIGKDVRLSCPISGYPRPIFEWAKGLEAIPEDSWERFKVQGQSLKIKHVSLDDRGQYSCKGVNGFGSARFLFHLDVQAPLDDIHESSLGSEPRIEQVYPSSGSIVTKEYGDSTLFKCQVSGFPPPDISWYKNGRQLTERNPDHRNSDGSPSASGFSLMLSSLIESDSGNYTCVAMNKHGAVTANWTLRVSTKSPEDMGGMIHPLSSSNVTVLSGEDAVLHCSGFWDTSILPKALWLRRVAAARLSKIPQNETFRYNGSHYQILQESKLLVSPDGKFLTKLVIPNAQSEDAGVYVCTINGINFRQTRLEIIDSGSETTPLMLVLGCSAGAIILVGIIVSIAMRRRRTKPSLPPCPSGRALLPPSGAIIQAKLQSAPPTHQPRYVIHPPPSSSHGTSGHSVAPEGSVVQFPTNMVHVAPQQLTSSGHSVNKQQSGQPIIVYQDPANSTSVYMASRPSTTTVSHPEYQYQHLDVI